MKVFQYLILVFGLAVAAVSCKKNDYNYRDLVSEGEINYTGKVDSVKVFPGNQRIRFTYLLKSDPKISKVIIYWNNFKDSAVQTVVRTTKVDTITTTINNIAEGTYTFTLVTYDNNGNSSIKQEAQGTVYGPKYETFLGNRQSISNEYTTGGDALISWYTADPQMLGAEIKYTDKNDVLKTVFAPSYQKETVLPNYKPGTTYQLRTFHQPDLRMIDTLKATAVTASLDWTEVTTTYLKNAGAPFLFATWDGTRYGTLKDWTVTGANNKTGGFGSYDNIAGKPSLAVSHLGAEAAVANAKIAQTVTLPAGTYSFIMYFNDTVSVAGMEMPFSLAGATGARVVVTTGTTWPTAVPNAITANTRAFAAINEKSVANFTLTASTQVSLGLWASYAAGVDGYVRASKVKLLKLN